jgi:DNA polymerase III subunit delta
VIDCEILEGNVRKGNIENCYIFCGLDEKLMKDSIKLIVDKVVDRNFLELNYVKFDGSKSEIDDVINACETLPFLSDKKVIMLYRAGFLGEKEDRDSKKKFQNISKYMENLPNHCVLIIYYVFEDEREKPSEHVKRLDKKFCVVKADKLKGDKFYRKVKEIFDSRGKDIGKIELKYFCDSIDNNMEIVAKEVDKLINYCEDRNVTKEDITKLLPPRSDDDIFDLVDYLSQKRPEKAIDILNGLIYSGENITGILFMIQRQFKLLLGVKLAIEKGKNKDAIAKELRLHPYVCEKLTVQSRKFTMKQIKNCLELCLNTEKVLKSSQTEKKTEMELLIVNTVRV